MDVLHMIDLLIQWSEGNLESYELDEFYEGLTDWERGLLTKHLRNAHDNFDIDL